MRSRSILYGIVLLLGATSCYKSVDPTAYTTDLNQARRWVIGQWRLERLSTMSGNTVVPDLEIIIDQTGQMIIVENGKPIDRIQTGIRQDSYNMLLEPVVNPVQAVRKWYHFKSILNVSQRELHLYVDPSSDSPIYTFKRTRYVL